jgi:hypothetical protein
MPKKAISFDAIHIAYMSPIVHSLQPIKCTCSLVALDFRSFPPAWDCLKLIGALEGACIQSGRSTSSAASGITQQRLNNIFADNSIMAAQADEGAAADTLRLF